MSQEAGASHSRTADSANPLRSREETHLTEERRATADVHLWPHMDKYTRTYRKRRTTLKAGCLCICPRYSDQPGTM